MNMFIVVDHDKEIVAVFQELELAKKTVALLPFQAVIHARRVLGKTWVHNFQMEQARAHGPKEEKHENQT